METEFDILIVGAGLAGLTTALACADSGASVALLDRRKIETGQDGRVTALSTTSVRLFENLGVDIAAHLQPIQDMLVTEGAPDSPWRLHFEGDGDGGDLGAIIENPPLKAALIEKLSATPLVRTIAPTDIFGFSEDVSDVTVETDKGTFSASLLIAADGRDSVLRRKAGITGQRFDYKAASLVTTIEHELPHDGLAWQRIIKGGALAVLPLTGKRSQIVWSGLTKSIDAAVTIPEFNFIDLLSEKMDGYLGEMKCIAPRQNYPLRLQVADSFSKGRIALVGDAAHIIHPLAGQGLNLGIRDAAALAAGIKAARETGQDIGVAGLLEYDLWRNADTRALGLLTHIISESSGSNFTAVGHMRRLSLMIADKLPPLKSALKKQASWENLDLPGLMNRP